LGLGDDNTAFETRPEEWTRAGSAAHLTDVPQAVEVASTRVTLFRHEGTPVALGGRCPHRGAPMDEGSLDGAVIVCPWHYSRFRIADGAVERGPSAMPLPVYDCRVRADEVEVRAHPEGASI